jgi:hypothetical protein
MHLANLACDHATGKRKRTVNKEIVDSFEECEDLRLAVRRMIEYVWNKKAKSRKINYEKHNEQIGYNVIKVGIDNDTRISSYARMYQHALRCKWTLHQYFAHKKSLVCNAYELSDERWQSVVKVKAIIRSICALSFTTQIDSRLVASASWPNIVKTKIAARQMTYSVVNIVLSSRSGEQSNEEDGYGGDGRWDGKTRWDYLPKVKVRAEQLGVISNKLRDHMQKELDSYFPFPSDQQLVAMICDPVMLTLALPWLCAAGYKDNVDNAKELFKSALVDEATRSLRPPEPNAMCNVPLDDDDIDVQVCDDDDVFGMVNLVHLARTLKVEQMLLSTQRLQVIWRTKPSRSGSC